MASLPSMNTWTSGSTVTAAQMNSQIRDASNYWISGRPILLTSNQASVALTTANTYYPMTWATSGTGFTVDRDGMLTNSTTITCQTAGYYLFTASPIIVSYINNGNVTLNWNVNGTSSDLTTKYSHATFVGSYLWCSVPPLTVYLSAGNTVQLQVQCAIAAQSTYSAALQHTTLSAYWLSA